MPIRYGVIQQRKRGETGVNHAPANLTFNVFDIFQTVADDILITPAPIALRTFGTGQYRCLAVAGTGGNTVEVFASLDSEDLYNAEKAANITAEVNSKMIWVKMGDATTDSTGLFSFDSPFTYFKFKFVGTAGTSSKVILAVN